MLKGFLRRFNPMDVLTEQDVHAIHNGVLEVLETTGVTFQHKKHEEKLKDQGCGICHHIGDDKQQKSIPTEDETVSCMDCHQVKKTGHIRALRQAYHGSCNKCHRKMKKEGKTTGPTTCGECHKK